MGTQYLVSHRLADLPPPVVTSMTRKFSGIMLGFDLSIPVFFGTTYAWLLWIAGPWWREPRGRENPLRTRPPIPHASWRVPVRRLYRLRV